MNIIYSKTGEFTDNFWPLHRRMVLTVKIAISVRSSEMERPQSIAFKEVVPTTVNFRTSLILALR